jgi:hypothetical protein
MPQDRTKSLDDKDSEKTVQLTGRTAIGLSARKLSKLIFDADLPEHIVRELPAQTLHLVTRHIGLEGAAELLEMASSEQRKLLIDFDIWKKDRLDEDRFFEWLGVTDATDSLELLQKIAKEFDLKILGIMIGRYCEVRMLEERSESPPEEGFYTPDKGGCWLRVHHPEERKSFLFSRLLALIFESNAAIFYNLIAVPSIVTESVLEEESLNERNKRLWAEGVPDLEFAFTMHAALTEGELKALLAEHTEPVTIDSSHSVAPLIHDSEALQPLDELAATIGHRDDFESELSLIMNCAIVRWGVDFTDQAEIAKLIRSVKCTINLGLEVAVRVSGKSALDVYLLRGLQPLYRAGLGQLRRVSRQASIVARSAGASLHEDASLGFAVESFRSPFPNMPNSFQSDGTIEKRPDGTITPEQRPFAHEAEITAALAMLKRLTPDTP